MANWDQTPHDQATLAIEAFDAGGNQLLYVSHDHRNPVWGYYEISAQIPSGCSTLRVYLIGTRYVGEANDAYFDDLSLTIDNDASSVNITAAGGKSVVVIGNTLQLIANTNGCVDHSNNWSSSYDVIATVNSKFWFDLSDQLNSLKLQLHNSIGFELHPENQKWIGIFSFA